MAVADGPEPAPSAPSAVAGVTAIVVNHDAGDALLSCVASLRAAGVGEIVVVDNASDDGALARLAAIDRDAVLVPTGRNLGYGRGVNAGLRRATGEVLLVCNPDLIVSPDAVERLAAFLRDATDVAVVGPTILESDGTRYPSARSFPDLSDAIGHAAMSLLWPDNPFTRRYRRSEEVFESASDADWVSGACMAIRRIAFESVAGFDPAYFMYVEDLDLCWRLHRAGWRVVHLSEAKVTHLGGISAARHPYRMLAAHHRSTLRFFMQSTTGLRRVLIPVVAGALGLRLVASWGLEAKKSLLRPQTAARGLVE
jgi:N-acetylglucosaminyl-diphospho-decaprenol L-rhamnosyltransferase